MTLYELLNELDNNDHSAFSKVEDKKELKAKLSWVLPQIMTSASDDADHRTLVMLFDEYCNDVWRGLSDASELQLKLLSSIGLGKKTYHPFFKPTASGKENELAKLLRREFPDIKRNEVSLFCRMIDSERFGDLLCRWGIPKDEQKKLRKQHEEERAR